MLTDNVPFTRVPQTNELAHAIITSYLPYGNERFGMRIKNGIEVD